MGQDVYEYVVKIQRDQIPKELVDKLKKLYGIPPYDGPSNFVRNDGYFRKSIFDYYGSEIARAAINLFINPMIEDMERAKSEFQSKWMEY